MKKENFNTLCFYSVLVIVFIIGIVTANQPSELEELKKEKLKLEIELLKK